MKTTVTLAESTAELRTAALRERPTARERAFLAVTVTIGPRLTPTLTVRPLGTRDAWAYTGWRAVRLFERVSGKAVGPMTLEGLGLTRRAV